MSVLQLQKTTDPIVRQKSEQINLFDDNLHKLVDDMFDTMYYNGGIGLAAVQIGVLKKVIVINLGEPNTELVMINAKIIEKSENKELQGEGCLSVDGLYGEANRSTSVTVQYQDLNGTTHIKEASGLMAQCIQHEVDHTEGRLFIDYEDTNITIGI